MTDQTLMPVANASYEWERFRVSDLSDKDLLHLIVNVAFSVANQWSNHLIATANDQRVEQLSTAIQTLSTNIEELGIYSDQHSKNDRALQSFVNTVNAQLAELKLQLAEIKSQQRKFDTQLEVFLAHMNMAHEISIVNQMPSGEKKRVKFSYNVDGTVKEAVQVDP